MYFHSGVTTAMDCADLAPQKLNSGRTSRTWSCGSVSSGSLPSALDPFVYALLLAWGEALASGMLFSALVIFSPHLVLTYRQDLYLPPRHAL